MSAGLFHYHSVQPFAGLGLTAPFWTLHSDIIIGTWVAMGILFSLTAIGQYFLSKKNSTVTFLYEKAVDCFINLSIDNIGSFQQKYFLFISSLFLFTAFCCLVSLIPFVEEATRDLNTALAIALSSFLYVQYQKIQLHGFKGFLQEFIDPFIIMAPLHVVGELSKIASMSFRLFGNIVGGGVILGMVIDLCGRYRLFVTPTIFCCIMLHILFSYIDYQNNFWLRATQKIVNLTLNILFAVTWLQIILGIGEAMMQSFVLTMLTATYLGMAMQHGADQHPHTPKHLPKEHL